MAVISVEKFNTIEQFRIKTNLLSSVVGDSVELSTFTNSSNIIDAIRELVGLSKSDVAIRQVIEGAFGWNMAPSDNTDTPSYILYTKGDSVVKTLITWVNNNPSIVVYQYRISTNPDVFTTKLTETITYDSTTENVSMIGWS